MLEAQQGPCPRSHHEDEVEPEVRPTSCAASPGLCLFYHSAEGLLGQRRGNGAEEGDSQRREDGRN